jgi:hypothetical protein
LMISGSAPTKGGTSVENAIAAQATKPRERRLQALDFPVALKAPSHDQCTLRDFYVTDVEVFRP